MMRGALRRRAVKVYKRALGERAAARCENATTPSCRCRCGGLAHGKARKGADGAAPMNLFDLPADDPHHPKYKGPKP